MNLTAYRDQKKTRRCTKHGKTHVEGKSLKRKDEYILNKSWYQIGNQNFELTNLLYISSP